MLKLKGISKVVNENVYYLIITSETSGIACEIKAQDAELILKSTPHKQKRTDPKTQIKEYEFITKKPKI